MKSAVNLLMMCSILMVMSSCAKTPTEVEREYLENKIEKFTFDNDKKWIVILPGLGCKGCLQEGEYFMKQHIAKKDILFVLTKIESLKFLQQKIGVDLANYPNVFIDRSNYFDLPTDDVIYPIIIELQNHKLKNFQFQSPKNGMAFSKFSERIQTM